MPTAQCALRRHPGLGREGQRRSHIKDLIVGAELAKLEKGRDEYLQKQAEAQRAVPEASSSRPCARCWPATVRGELTQIFSEPSAFIAHSTAAITPLQRGNRNNVSPTISGR